MENTDLTLELARLKDEAALQAWVKKLEPVPSGVKTLSIPRENFADYRQRLWQVLQGQMFTLMRNQQNVPVVVTKKALNGLNR